MGESIDRFSHVGGSIGEVYTGRLHPDQVFHHDNAWTTDRSKSGANPGRTSIRAEPTRTTNGASVSRPEATGTGSQSTGAGNLWTQYCRCRPLYPFWRHHSACPRPLARNSTTNPAHSWRSSSRSFNDERQEKCSEDSPARLPRPPPHQGDTADNWSGNGGYCVCGPNRSIT